MFRDIKKGDTKPPSLFYLLANVSDDGLFEAALRLALENGAKINALGEIDEDDGKIVYGRQTILDVATAFFPSRVPILRELDAQTAKECGYAFSGIHDSISGRPYDQDRLTLETVGSFSVSESDELRPVSPELTEDGIDDASDTGVINVNKILRKAANSIIELFDDTTDSRIGTGTFIAPDLVLVSRHCLNGLALEELSVYSKALDRSFQIQAVVENGEKVKLDYAILKLDASIEEKNYSTVCFDHAPTHTIFVGYDETDTLCYSNFTTQPDTFAHIDGDHEAFQETAAGISGSPYFNGDGAVYAIHQNTSYERKGALFFSTIQDMNKQTILTRLTSTEGSAPWGLAETAPPMSDRRLVFSDFSLSTPHEQDEGASRGQTLGKNPSVGSDHLTIRRGEKNNIVCQEVLLRWFGNGKARYKGKEKKSLGQIKDWSKWEVLVRKTDNGVREWVMLDPKTIQMGHKLSAVSYWVYGYNKKKNVILRTFFAKYKSRDQTTKKDKIARYDARYAQYTTAGFLRLEKEGPEGAKINRRFMYDAKNYRFEWGALNEKNGREESQILQYSTIFTLPECKHKDLTDYRKLREDKETTPALREQLTARKQKLEEAVMEFKTFKVKQKP